MTCNYCGREAKLVDGTVIYPRYPDLAEKLFWQCRPCDAYVGCHDGTERPLGTLADLELRQARQAVHAVFDRIWRQGLLSRSAAYCWLAGELNIGAAACHVGMFTLEQCAAALAACRAAGYRSQVRA